MSEIINKFLTSFIVLSVLVIADFHNLRFNENSQRRLDENTKDLVLSVKVLKDSPVYCDDNETVVLPLFNFESNNNITDINISLTTPPLDGIDLNLYNCTTNSTSEIVYGINVTNIISNLTDSFNSSYEFEVDINSTDLKFDYLFANVSKIKEVNLAVFANLTINSLKGMFANSPDLDYVNFGNFSFENVTDVSFLFQNCGNLTNVSFGEVENITEITTVEGMFSGCSSLEYVDITPFTFEKIENATELFQNCTKLINITFERTINVTVLANVDGMFSGCENIEKIDLKPFNFRNVKSMKKAFHGCKKLQTLEFRPQNDMENIEDLSFLFYGCENLKTVDLKMFKFEKVKNMSNLFSNCTNLTNVTFPDGVSNATQVETIDNMFYGCQKLERFDFKVFRFEKLEYVSNVFFNCRGLTEIHFEDFYCRNCKKIDRMFHGCSSLRKIDLSGFKTSSVLLDVTNLFYGCTTLENCSLQNFVFGDNCSVDGMFSSCTLLTSLDMSYVYVPSSINISSMFSEVNLSNMEINLFGANVTDNFTSYLNSSNATITYKNTTIENNTNTTDANTTDTNTTDNKTDTNTTDNTTDTNKTDTDTNTTDTNTTDTNTTIIPEDAVKASTATGGAIAGITVACVVVVAVAVTVAVTVSTTVATTASTVAATSVATGVSTAVGAAGVSGASSVATTTALAAGAAAV